VGRYEGTNALLGRDGIQSHRYAVPLDLRIRWEPRPPSLDKCLVQTPILCTCIAKRSQRTKRSDHGFNERNKRTLMDVCAY